MSRPQAFWSKLPDERSAITHKFDINGHEGFITVSLYEDGMPGELFLVVAKEGSTTSGFADAFAEAISYALQCGVPLQVLADKFTGMRFEPSGMTRNPQIRVAKSIIDYVFRWLATKFLSTDHVEQMVNFDNVDGVLVPKLPLTGGLPSDQDGRPCNNCGATMIVVGSDYRCPNCDPVGRQALKV